MAFRTRLILAFALLSLLQAGLFTALSDQLLRDAMGAEAAARLELLGVQGESLADRQGGQAFARLHGLDRVTLLAGDGVWDSVDPDPGLRDAASWAAGDGLVLPAGRGRVGLSGPLFRAEGEWRLVHYARRGDGAWLRLEAGEAFLQRVPALQRRLLRLSLALALPALALGLGLAWLLSLRVKALERRLAEPQAGVRLEGGDEFARISRGVEELLEGLAKERERADRLAQARLAQAHDLARGVAHELRNPLASLSLLTDLLLRRRREGADGAELEELAARLQGELGRLEGTVARFMEFARRPTLEPASVDLGALAEGVSGLQPRPEVQGSVKAWADPQAASLVLGVLLTNAAEAAGRGGSVRVWARTRDGRAVAEVWDSGPPLPPEEAAKVFTPFFTTKPKGLGLGLATAASLADHMGGALTLLPDAKTFRLELPLPPREA